MKKIPASIFSSARYKRQTFPDNSTCRRSPLRLTPLGTRPRQSSTNLPAPALSPTSHSKMPAATEMVSNGTRVNGKSKYDAIPGPLGLGAASLEGKVALVTGAGTLFTFSSLSLPPMVGIGQSWEVARVRTARAVYPNSCPVSACPRPTPTELLAAHAHFDEYTFRVSFRPGVNLMHPIFLFVSILSRHA